jgi:LAO/AO transport system kinase
LTDADKIALHVRPGCAIPEPISRKRTARQKKIVSPSLLVEGIRNGDRSLLARAITLIESSRTQDHKIAEQIIDHCMGMSGNSIRVGITGVPGAGKSSLIEALGRYLIERCGEKVAVLTIDPSSQLSGGSILGDKTRMPFLAASQMAFIRPSPSRGMHGGVAQHTREAIVLCEAAGYRNILVETVGVGQAEAAVRDIVDFFLLVTIAGAGDELQGIKRGVMEMADAVAVNKADGANVSAAERARLDAENALHFQPPSLSTWRPRAVTCSAHTGCGIAELWSCVREYASITKANNWFEQARREQARRAMHQIFEQKIMDLFHADPVVQQQMTDLERKVVAGQATTVSAALELLSLFAERINVVSGRHRDK